MKIKEAFEKAKKENRIAVIPYFTAGYPTLNYSYRVFLEMAKSGADIIEVGIPFSDPLADGPTIQFSSSEALAKEVNTDDILNMISNLSKKTDVPIVVMTYYNILLVYGLEKFCNNSHKAGVKGVIIPDFPPEEANSWIKLSKDKLETIFLTAPTSSLNRIKHVTNKSSGFVYCVSLAGVTGANKKLDNKTISYIKNVRKLSRKPVAVGFGISSASQAKQLKGIADGVIVGSAFIKLYRKAGNLNKALKKISNLIRSLRKI